MIQFVKKGTAWSNYPLKATHPVSPFFFNSDGEDDEMQEEIWRPVVGFERSYSVSNMGRVKSIDREHIDSIGRVCRFKSKIKSQYEERSGYYSVYLTRATKKKNMPVHRVVSEAFMGPRPDKLVTDHIDGDIKNNKLSNLQYVTARENTVKGKSCRLNKNKTSEFEGVTYDKHKGLWRARKSHGGFRYHLGFFRVERDAYDAYLSADEDYCIRIYDGTRGH